MPPSSIGRRREPPTENDEAQLTSARRSIRSRFTNRNGPNGCERLPRPRRWSDAALETPADSRPSPAHNRGGGAVSHR